MEATPILNPIPRLSLTHGQVLWAISEGQEPNKQMVDQFRYLRQVGIPFTKEELGYGRGNRLRYDFDKFIESGVALWALRHGLRPRDLVKLLVGNREEFRQMYRKAFESQPPERLLEPWVKSRGRRAALYKDPGLLLGLHDRYSETPLRYDMIFLPWEGGDLGAQMGDVVAEFADGERKLMLPLSQRVLVWVAWALEAPEFRTGPQ